MIPERARNRIQSLDILRGTVMVIMALDHARDFLYKADLSKAADAALDPTNMQTTFPALFFTRWITHFCAPIFIFLAGTSVYLMSQRLTKNELSIFLFKRGLWLVLLEITIITFGWTFNPHHNIIILQVIWAIGVSMILLGLLVQLPFKVIFIIGFILVAGHNLSDFLLTDSALRKNIFIELMLTVNFSFHEFMPGYFFAIIYCILPWTGVMLLGFCFGKLYETNSSTAQRRKTLIRLGMVLIMAFTIIRLINIYGDPVPWSVQPRGATITFLSFLNLTKYPPSLLFICMTLGPAMIFLAVIEQLQNSFTKIMNVYGRVPMLYYVLHFYIIHLITVIVFYWQGFGPSDITSPNNPFYFKPNGIGFGLLGLYAIWVFVVAILYPVCKWFANYKSTHKQWWLSYL